MKEFVQLAISALNTVLLYGLFDALYYENAIACAFLGFMLGVLICLMAGVVSLFKKPEQK